MAIILILLVVFLGTFCLLEHFELKKYKVTFYKTVSDKIEHPMKIVVLADLHGHVYAPSNEPLIQSVMDCHPNVILIPGDLITSTKKESYEIGIALLKRLESICPVFYSNGNHESRAKCASDGRRSYYEQFENELKKMQVHQINNETMHETICENLCTISGLEIGLHYYSKGKKVSMDSDYIEQKLGTADSNAFQILLAHNPAFFQQYKKWGADLTVGGHMHGGLIRIPKLGSVISPQFELFPKYDAGFFQEEGHDLIVSKGLGTHTFNIRILNRAEVVCLDLIPESTAE